MSYSIKGNTLERSDLDGLFQEYYPRIFNYLYYRTLDRATADDLASNVMVSIVRNFASYDAQKGTLDAWVFRIARNELYSYYRSRRPTVDIDAVGEGAFATTDDEDVLDERGQMVRELLTHLTEDERELIYMKYWEELSNKEIAERLGLNPSTVSTQLWRANNKMRSALPDA